MVFSYPCPKSASVVAHHSALFIDRFLNCRPVDFIGEHSFCVLSYSVLSWMEITFSFFLDRGVEEATGVGVGVGVELEAVGVV